MMKKLLALAFLLAATPALAGQVQHPQNSGGAAATASGYNAAGAASSPDQVNYVTTLTALAGGIALPACNHANWQYPIEYWNFTGGPALYVYPKSGDTIAPMYAGAPVPVQYSARFVCVSPHQWMTDATSVFAEEPIAAHVVDGAIHISLNQAAPINQYAPVSGTVLNASASELDFNQGAILVFPDGDTSSLALGTSALAGQTTASSGRNTTVGVQAGQNVSSGTNETLIGYEAGQWTTTGNQNIFIGAVAGRGISGTPLTGSGNVGIGYEALTVLQGAGNDNTALGWAAGFSATTPSADTFLGFQAGEYDQTGGSNTFVGYSAGQGASGNMLTGAGNTALGASSAAAIQGAAQSDTVIGENAGIRVTTGSMNVIIGQAAGSQLTTGGSNTIIGRGCGSTTLATGSHNLLIGTDTSCDAPSSSTSDELNIGGVIGGTEKDASHARVCAVGMQCVLGVLYGANFNVTTDQAITIDPFTATDAGYLPAATKYRITNIYVTNCSASLTTAQGGVYTAASKGGTTLVASSQAYTGCTGTTALQIATLASGATGNVFTASTLDLSLTTAQGATATGDVYVEGVPLN